MRFTQLALVIAIGIASPFSVLAQAKAKDEQAIRKILSDFAATWNANDMGAFGQLFAPDADLVDITGKLLKGRSEIQAYHSDLTARLYKGSRLVWIPADIRFLKRDVALAHVSTEISFNEGKDKRTSFALVVLTKQGGRWSIASVQNTLTGGAPVQPRGPN